MTALAPARALRSSARGTLHGTDILLTVILALTTVDISFNVGGLPVGLGEILLVPVLVVQLLSPARGFLPLGYAAAAIGYLLWVAVTLTWARDLHAALGPTIQYVEFFLLVALLFIRVRNLRGLLACMKVYIACAAILSIAVIVYSVATRSFSYVYFLNYQKNYLGATVADAIPLILGLLLISQRGRRKLLVVALMLTAVVLLMSTSRGALLGTVVGIGVFLILIRRVRYGIFLALGGIAIFTIFSVWIAPGYLNGITDFSEGSSAYSRLVIYNDAWQFIATQPWIGHGPGSYHINIPSIGFSQSDPSNVFLLNLAELGIVGLILFVVLLLVIAHHAGRNVRRFRDQRVYLIISASLVAAFVVQLTHIQIDVSWVRGTGTFMFACIGLMMKLPRLVEEHESGLSAPTSLTFHR